ncbi:MAG: hypothetical protein IJS15_13335 [Victivallales bacterium]|nr:hypothetical protein [Victivallales bacterium]
MKTIIPYLLCLMSIPLAAQFNSYILPKATGKIVIDGKLDDADWQKKPLISEFHPFNAPNAELPKTSIWMVQEDDSLVIAAECMEEFPSALVTKAFHDGSVWTDDHVEFFFDTAGERKSCAQILVNSIGTVADGIIARQGTTPDWGWECGAELKTAVLTDRWILEMRIPFSSFLPFTPGTDWTFHVARSRYTMNSLHLTSLKGDIRGFHEMQFFDTLGGIKCEPTGIIVLSQSFGSLFEGQNQATLDLKNDNDSERKLTIALDLASAKGDTTTSRKDFTIPAKSQMTAKIDWKCTLENEGMPISMRLEMNDKRLQSFSTLLKGIRPTLGDLRQNVLSFGQNSPAVAEFPLNILIKDKELTLHWELRTDDGNSFLLSGFTAVSSNQQKIRIYRSFLKPGLYRLHRFLLEDERPIVIREDRIALTQSPWE